MFDQNERGGQTQMLHGDRAAVLEEARLRGIHKDVIKMMGDVLRVNSGRVVRERLRRKLDARRAS
jgi:hypothetical protein